VKVHELNMPHTTTKDTPLPYSDDACTGYVRRVTHDEIADAVGLNLKEILGTPAHLNSKEEGTTAYRESGRKAKVL
jgi:hypothetical protein